MEPNYSLNIEMKFWCGMTSFECDKERLTYKIYNSKVSGRMKNGMRGRMCLNT